MCVTEARQCLEEGADEDGHAGHALERAQRPERAHGAESGEVAEAGDEDREPRLRPATPLGSTRVHARLHVHVRVGPVLPGSAVFQMACVLREERRKGGVSCVCMCDARAAVEGRMARTRATTTKSSWHQTSRKYECECTSEQV